MPKQVQWEQNKKVAKKKWGSMKLKQSIAGRLRSLNLSLHAGAVSIPGALGGLDEGDEDASPLALSADAVKGGENDSVDEEHDDENSVVLSQSADLPESNLLATRHFGACGALLDDFIKGLKGSMGSTLRELLAATKGTPVGRCFKFLYKERFLHSINISKCNVPNQAEESPLLPLHLPPLPDYLFGELGVARKSRRLTQRINNRRAGWLMTSFNVASFNYWETGCPKSPQALKRAMGPYNITLRQQHAFDYFCFGYTACSVNNSHAIYMSV